MFVDGKDEGHILRKYKKEDIARKKSIVRNNRLVYSGNFCFY